MKKFMISIFACLIMSVGLLGLSACTPDNDDPPATPTPKYSVTLVANDENAGTVSGSGTYEVESVIYISATPKQGYYFSHWSDDSTSASRPLIITGEMTLTAYFYAI